MPKLTRYLQKIFANNSNQVGVFGTGVDKETSKNVETLQSADYEDGWSAAVITDKNYPIWQEMDGVQYGLSYQIKYLQQAGIPEWLSTETYYANTSFCQYGGKIYQSLQDDNTNHSPALQDGWWTPLLTSSRSIGEIIPSTIPLTDAGLHLLDGALISSGMYADFVTYMANLTATAPDCFCTEAQWQTAVSTYGVCGKFVYDSVNNTVRLPKIEGFIEGGTTATIGDLVEAGLPNITGMLSTIGGDAGFVATGAFYDAGTGGNLPNSGEADKKVGFDASRSSSIYGNSTTVQPQAVKVLYYIVVATTTKTDIEVDIDEIATDLNGKADVDLSNMNASASAKETIVGWGIPDYSSNSAISVSFSTSTTYDTLLITAPSDGYIVGRAWATAQICRITLIIKENGTIVVQGGNCNPSTGSGNDSYSIVSFPIAKGQTVHLGATILNGAGDVKFYPMKGV